MSEYQYVAFRAIDGPVSEKNLEFMHNQSTRAEITPWSFDNEYHYGDFRGKTLEMLRRGYDFHFHYANFGTRTLMFRFSEGLPDPEAAKPYLEKHCCELIKDKRGRGRFCVSIPILMLVSWRICNNSSRGTSHRRSQSLRSAASRRFAALSILGSSRLAGQVGRVMKPQKTHYARSMVRGLVKTLRLQDAVVGQGPPCLDRVCESNTNHSWSGGRVARVDQREPPGRDAFDLSRLHANR